MRCEEFAEFGSGGGEEKNVTRRPPDPLRSLSRAESTLQTQPGSSQCREGDHDRQPAGTPVCRSDAGCRQIADGRLPRRCGFIALRLAVFASTLWFFTLFCRASICFCARLAGFGLARSALAIGLVVTLRLPV